MALARNPSQDGTVGILGTVTDINGDAAAKALIPAVTVVDADGVSATPGAPTTSSTAALAPAATAAAASSLVLKAAAGNLYGFSVASGASAGYVLVLNAASAPADGPVTPLKAYAIAANSSVDRAFNPPLRFTTGITIVFSTTGPFTKTASATAFISGEAV